MFKKGRARGSIRTRVVDDDPPSASTDGPSSQSDEAGSGSVMERTKARKKATKGAAGAGGSRLSFGGDEEADTTAFKQKKSLLSQALKNSSSLAPSTTAAGAAPASTGSPSYSQSYLSELKAATPTRGPREATGDESLGFSQEAIDKYGATLVEDSTAGIPDAVAIAAAKSRRKAALDARRAGADVEEDFISLGDSGTASRGPHPESRLMREEDEGEDGDEDLAGYTEANERLYIGKKANKLAARRLKGEIGELIADREDENESDEETREWEETILANAGQLPRETEVQKRKPARTQYIPAPIPVARPVPSLSSAESRIAQRMSKLRAAKEENEKNLDTAMRDLVILEDQERDIKRQVEEVEGKREWVEQFQGWVETLGNFLEEKFPKLEDIEKDSMKYQKERSTIVSTRRAADDNDDLSLFLGIPTPTQEQDPDESGANSEPRRIRRQARADRRARRRGVTAPADDEGLSTDSELDDDMSDDFTASQHDLERRVHSLLEDVKAEDFRHPEKGLAVHFGAWRDRYPDDYSGAFGGLSLVQAWEFWARGEMVGWDPLRSDTAIHSFTWFVALYDYSRPRVLSQDDDDDDMDIEPELGPEGDLASEMVSKAVIPLVTKALEAGAYDPYSAPQTRRAVDLMEVIADLTGKDSKKYTALLKAVIGVFQSHVLELATAVQLAGGPSAQRSPPYSPAARSAMQRYVRRRLKLMRNLMLWRRAAPTEVGDLVQRLVSVVLRPVFARTWEGGGEDMAKAVLELASPLLTPNLVTFLVTFLQKGPLMR